jgi:hypothetical protein
MVHSFFRANADRKPKLRTTHNIYRDTGGNSKRTPSPEQAKRNLAGELSTYESFLVYQLQKGAPHPHQPQPGGHGRAGILGEPKCAAATRKRPLPRRKGPVFAKDLHQNDLFSSCRLHVPLRPTTATVFSALFTASFRASFLVFPYTATTRTTERPRTHCQHSKLM